MDTLNEFSYRFPSTFSKECLRGVTSSCFAVFEGFSLSLLLRTWISAALHFNAQAQQRPWRGAMGATVPVPCVDRPERTPETNPDQPPFDYPRYGRPVHIEPVSTHSQEFFSSFYDKESQIALTLLLIQVLQPIRGCCRRKSFDHLGGVYFRNLGSTASWMDTGS